jgi:chromosome segregation ATPase
MISCLVSSLSWGGQWALTMRLHVGARQGMVPRAELLAAQSEVKAHRDEAAVKGKDHAWLEGQLAKAQEQVSSARVEAARLQAEMGGMVSRAELEAAKAKLAEAEAAARAEAEKHQRLLGELNGRVSALEKDKSALGLKMQASRARRERAGPPRRSDAPPRRRRAWRSGRSSSAPGTAAALRPAARAAPPRLWPASR